MKYYIASCIFTVRFPELSQKIQRYVAARPDIQIVRCCTPQWKVKIYEDRMPEGDLRNAWAALPHTATFKPGDEVYSLCANCSNIIEECHEGVSVRSLWELIDGDASFALPDYAGLKATLQDCWRSRERADVQDAVRSLLRKMHVDFLEAEKCRAETDFCGVSLYKPQVARNPLLAPKHYREGAAGLFLPHTEEEQKQLMLEHCGRYTTDTVICYCHYCLEGLLVGGVHGVHLAQMLFEKI